MAKQNNKKQHHHNETMPANARVLAELDLFSMLGLENSKVADKSKLFIDLQENIWLDVIGRCIENELSPEDIEKLKALLQEKSSAQEVLPFLSQRIKNFPSLVFESTLAYKKRYFLDYLELLSQTVSAKEKTHRRHSEDKGQRHEQLEFLHKLSQYAATDQWEEVRNLLPQFNNYNIS